jgi:uncharacterized membrane protein YedE/YeeE
VANELGNATVTSSRVPGLSPTETKRVAISGTIALALIVGAFLLAAKTPDNSTKPLMLLVGGALGLAFERGRFCFYCIFGDAIRKRETVGLQSIFVALAVGAIGHVVIFGLYLPNPQGEGLPPSAHISPVSWPLALGAFAFGIGMSLSGACLSGHLYRLGQGYFRAIPALIGSLIGFGLGFITWNTLYLNQISEGSEWWLPRKLGYGTSLIALLSLLALLSLACVRINQSREVSEIQPLSESPRNSFLYTKWGPITTGSIVGGIGILSYLRLEPLGVTAQLSTVSRTFMDSRDLLPEVLHGIDLMKGCVGVVTTAITENGWLLIGFVLASFASAILADRFKPTMPTVGNGFTAVLGGILLGWGSMTALGCTVGNLLSGTQSFATSGLLFGVVSFIGVWIGIRLRLDSIFK